MDWQVELAFSIAEKAHDGQFDRAGKPYIEHPMAVASMVTNDKEKAVAYLHDVLEDTDMTMDDLRGYGFDYDVLYSIRLLTRPPELSYMSHIRLIRDTGHKIAIEVKKADLRHNMDLTRLKKVTVKDIERQEKYLTAYKMLMGRYSD